MDTDRVEAVIETFCEDREADVRLTAAEVVLDDDTGEELLEVIVNVPPGLAGQGPRPAFLEPVVLAYVQLVAAGTVDVPLEAVVCARHEEWDNMIAGAIGAFRIETDWARRHVAGDLALEQLVHLAVETYREPEDDTAAQSGWAPEYGTDWSDIEPPSTDAFEETVAYEEWADTDA